MKPNRLDDLEEFCRLLESDTEVCRSDIREARHEVNKTQRDIVRHLWALYVWCIVLTIFALTTQIDYWLN